MWHFVAASMASLSVFQSFLNGYDNGVGFTTNFRDEIRKIERSNLEPSNSKLGSWNLYLVCYFAQISCPFWTQSTLDIGYLKLRCLIKALSLTCSTSLTCYVWLLHGCLKKLQKILSLKIAKYFWFPRLRPFPIGPPSPAHASGAEGFGEEVGGGWRHWKLTEFELSSDFTRFHQTLQGFF